VTCPWTGLRVFRAQASRTGSESITFWREGFSDAAVDIELLIVKFHRARVRVGADREYEDWQNTRAIFGAQRSVANDPKQTLY
jgi:hypothetical protein